MATPERDVGEFNLDDVDVNNTLFYTVTLQHFELRFTIEYACNAVDANVASHRAEAANPGYIFVRVDKGRDMRPA